MKVLVLILETETKKSDNQIENLLFLFSDPLFEVHQCSFPKKIQEDRMLKKALHYASHGPYESGKEGKWKDDPVIIIKDSSICDLSPERFTKKIKDGLEYGKEADIIYLCKWNDLCELYKDVTVSKSKSFLQWTQRPNGMQALLFKPKARDILYKEWMDDRYHGSIQERIQQKIKKGEWKALTYTPNIISFDIHYATTKSDYMKRNECAELKEMITNYVSSSDSSDNTMNIIYIILFAIFIFFVAFICVHYT